MEAIEEGDICPVGLCDGVMAYVKQGDCYCHISPPCSFCVDAPLECDVCGYNPEVDNAP